MVSEHYKNSKTAQSFEDVRNGQQSASGIAKASRRERSLPCIINLASNQPLSSNSHVLCTAHLPSPWLGLKRLLRCRIAYCLAIYHLSFKVLLEQPSSSGAETKLRLNKAFQLGLRYGSLLTLKLRSDSTHIATSLDPSALTIDNNTMCWHSRPATLAMLDQCLDCDIFVHLPNYSIAQRSKVMYKMQYLFASLLKHHTQQHLLPSL
jgi:hypothetical protein